MHFYTGMGQDPTWRVREWNLFIWLPKTLIAWALVFQHLAKILLAGLLFFSFLPSAACIQPPQHTQFAVALVFRLQCMGAIWYPLADEVVSLKWTSLRHWK